VIKINIVIIALLFSVCLQAQQSGSMRKLTNVDLHRADGEYSACWGYTAPNGREYGILGCAMGTAFVDISDTANIREVAYLPGLNQISCCREMKTYSHYAYVIADGIASGLQIIDLQYLPDSVRLVNTFFFSGFTRGHTISQEGPYLYINAGDYNIGGLFVLDLTNDPVNPIKRGEWEESVVHDSRIVNDTIYACNIYNPPGTISVIDATDKNNLRTIGSWENLPNPGPHNIALSPDRKYAYVTDEIGGNPRLLKIWDISDLNNVVKLAEWQPTGITTSIIHNVELFGNYLFAAHYTAGLRVIDVSNPSNPVEAAWYDTYPANDGFTYDGCWGPYIFESEKIIASDRSTGLYVFRTNFPLKTPNPSVPNYFSLSQNFPNPFNPLTTINFTLKYDSYVKLEVFNTLGEQVLLLANSQFGKGFRSITFNGSEFPSGVYFYRITVTYLEGITKEFTESRKMVLLK
jgi:choice-of-anchor B domain-containing protein